MPASPSVLAPPRFLSAPTPEGITDGVRRRVLESQVKSLYQHMASASLISTVFAALLAIYLAPTFGPEVTYTWLAFKAAIAGGRFLLAKAYRVRGSAWRLETAHGLVIGSLVLDGAIWGVAGLGVAHATNEIVCLLVACLSSVAMLATFGLQVRRRATAGYVVPLLLPMTATLASRGDAFGLFLALGMLLVLAQTLVTGYASEQRMLREFVAHEKTAEALQDRSQALSQLEEALEQVRRQSAIKALFLGTMSHELRTPLHGILGLTELLEQQTTEPIARHRLELIESSGRHLLELIGALLDVSRIDAGRLELHPVPFDLRTELRNIADLYEIRCQGKGLAFNAHCRMPETPWVRGDAARIRQVLHNLLGNAVKFTQRGSVSLDVRPKGAGLWSFAIIDTGPGIASADLEHIFEAFRQVDETKVRPADGTGLGLTIARELARAMEGDIVVSSAEGVGSRFTFTARLEAVPLEEIPPIDEKLTRRAPRLPRGCRVLLVEDNEVNALIASAHLAELGAEVVRAHDGKEAVEAAFQEPRPDVVLMDCRMPVMDGPHATEEIRAVERTSRLPHVPIIALTASPTDEEKQACQAAGMTGFLAKPYTMDQLLREIASALRIAAEERMRSHPLYEFACTIDDMEPDLFGDVTLH